MLSCLTPCPAAEVRDVRRFRPPRRRNTIVKFPMPPFPLGHPQADPHGTECPVCNPFFERRYARGCRFGPRHYHNGEGRYLVLQTLGPSEPLETEVPGFLTTSAGAFRDRSPWNPSRHQGTFWDRMVGTANATWLYPI